MFRGFGTDSRRADSAINQFGKEIDERTRIERQPAQLKSCLRNNPRATFIAVSIPWLTGV